MNGGAAVGFIGLGAMGAPMARHLANSGVNALVYDINRHAVQSVVACGARAVATPKAIADAARIVFTCLPSLEALRHVVLGDQGLIHGKAIMTYVDFSTTGAEFAQDLSATLKTAGIRMLDAPITGNVITAGNGKLGVMCSGPRAAFTHAAPTLRTLASAMVLYIGPESGKAQTMKLLNNLLSATGMAASCEAFILGVKAGLAPEKMLAVINAGEASNSATRNKFARAVLPRRFDFGARMAITIKDITTSVKESEALGVPMWIARAIRELWAYAISQGASEKDGTALITYLEKWAKVKVRGGVARDDTKRVKRRKPALSKDAPLVLVCEARLQPALARRLQQCGWMVLDDTSAQDHRARGEKHCRLIGLKDGDSALRVIQARAAEKSHRNAIYVNLCVSRAADARTTGDALARLGAGYLDAPLTGTTSDARRGAQMVIASGDERIFTRVQPLLTALGDRVFHVSELPGLAQLMHQIQGALASTLLGVTCEAFVAGAKAHLTPEIMTRVMGIETGRNAASAHIVPEQIATRKFRHGKRIGEACRELDLLSDEAARLGVTIWVADKVRQLYRLASQLGSPDDDITRLITHYEKWARVKVRASTRGAT